MRSIVPYREDVASLVQSKHHAGFVDHVLDARVHEATHKRVVALGKRGR